VRLACPLAETNDLQRYGAIETLLPGAKHDALTASPYFFEQFVVTEFSNHFGEALALISRASWFVRVAGVIPLRRGYGGQGDLGYSFLSE